MDHVSFSFLTYKRTIGASIKHVILGVLFRAGKSSARAMNQAEERIKLLKDNSPWTEKVQKKEEDSLAVGLYVEG